jgi:hypothetical protein
MDDEKERKDKEQRQREDLGCLIFVIIFVLWAWITGSGMEALFKSLSGQ